MNPVHTFPPFSLRSVLILSSHIRPRLQSDIFPWGKSKVVPVLNWAPRHEDVLREWRYSSTHCVTSALDGGECLATRPGRFTPRERSPGTHWIGGWVVSRAVLDAVVKRRIPSPRRESNPRTTIVQPVAQRYTDWAITVVPLRLWDRYFVCISHIFHACYMPFPCHPPWFDQPNNIWCSVQVMKLLTMQYSAASRDLTPS
jgi:hypothetical protein